MTDILVRPPELRQISEQLRTSANKIGTALQAIDNDILSLKGDKFLGIRANTVQSHYAPKRDSLINAKSIVEYFAGDLENVAIKFEQADNDALGDSSNQEHEVIYASIFPWVMPEDLSPEYRMKLEIEEQYGEYLRKYSKESGVPYEYLLMVVVKERLDYGILGFVKDSLGKLLSDKKVSLGLGQIEIERAAELEHPDRDWDKEPLTTEEINQYEAKLENPEDNIRILSMELSDNYKYYGSHSGKTEVDQWKFAIAKHKSGHGPIGEAQVSAEMEGKDNNKWDNVSPYLDQKISDFVKIVISGPPLPPGTVVA